MSLRSRYEEALASAEIRAKKRANAGRGESGIVVLQKGAAFRVLLEGTRITVELRREHKPVGFPTEEATFCKHFSIPARARREDLGRELSWYRVTYTWDRADDPPPAPVAEQEGLGL